MFGPVARWLVGMALCGVCLPGWADPPVTVGRVALVTGDVALVPAAGEEELASPANFPLMTGALLRSGGDGRAEIEFVGLRLWLGNNSELAISEVGDVALRVELLEGTLIARADEPGLRAAPQVVAAGAVADLKHAGHYRFSATVAAATIGVRDGLARVEAAGTVAYLTEGQQVEVSFGALGEPENVAAVVAAAADDDFTSWVATRVPAPADTAPRYVSSGMPGWRDLETYGRWEQSADYGPMWTPDWVPVGWAPYRFGTWVWLAPWGWTWVDRAPWGFAPFHFGRWTQHRGRWCWVPGAHVPRPVFAPALVTFGTASTVVVTPPMRRQRPQQWAPLAPHERFVPPFQASNRFVDQVNASHTRWFRRGGAAPQWAAGSNAAWTTAGGEMGAQPWRRGRGDAWPGERAMGRGETGGVLPLPAATLPLTSAPARVGGGVPPVQVAPVRVGPVQVAPVQVPPVRVAPVQMAPVQMAPVQVAPVQIAPIMPRRDASQFGRSGRPHHNNSGGSSGSSNSSGSNSSGGSSGSRYMILPPRADSVPGIPYSPVPAGRAPMAAPAPSFPAGRSDGAFGQGMGRSAQRPSAAEIPRVVPPMQVAPATPMSPQKSWRGRRGEGDGQPWGGGRQQQGGGRRY